MRSLFILCLGILSLFARENPFKPVIDSTVLPVTSNQVKKVPPFETVKVKLPRDARILTSVAFYYQSIDGSIKKEIVAVDRSIDWHKPIVVVQEGGSARGTPKVSSRKPQTKRTHKKIEPSSTYRPLPFLSLEVAEKRIHIITKDRKIRSFHLTHPFKVAIDFKREAGFLTKHIPLKTPPFRAMDIGNHNGYYRVVVTFDAPYRYSIEKTDDGYLLDVR
ncbi:AMIN domain-containing protein [Hydrogenimonas cancrithermarum]|uniref:AMIN domain-containing protein n=1 Tax=Hydrogenimonas cancrithermarum TaxID=2993563 RepID=A0ABN6WXX9_9BACT|nr:AMIN domain-containing protein [Hydrogenimonas cancrithermarum]BDY12860.1 AMIN domain-containing protein [Hydrogenimonas cancrithermarum]BDY12977.1 AMIN domain-containing protein [Hydrogenimonas cancrithermarum]